MTDSWTPDGFPKAPDGVPVPVAPDSLPRAPDGVLGGWDATLAKVFALSHIKAPLSLPETKTKLILMTCKSKVSADQIMNDCYFFGNLLVIFAIFLFCSAAFFGFG